MQSVYAETIYRDTAKAIRSAMTTPAARCYRISKLPRCATVDAIAKIVKAYTTQEPSDWAAVHDTDLYQRNGGSYCCILCVVAAAIDKQQARAAAAKEMDQNDQ